MPTRKVLIIVSAFLSLGLAACASGFKATYDSDPSHDFSGYQTYAWMSANPMIVGPTNRMPNPLLEPKIMAAMEGVLTAKGYSKVDDPESADFVLSFTVGSREEIQVNSYPATYAGYGYRGAWGWGGPYYGMATETQVRQYQKGMLALDVFDVKEHRPVFHAVAEKSISESDRTNSVETLQAAVDAVLQAFPPE